MPRIDIWEVEAARKAPAVDCGFPRDLEAHFEWGRALGKGGFGMVRVVVERSSGIEFACKSVAKTLDIPNLSAQKQAQHIDNIKREIKILTRLRGTLSVVHFKGAFEDDESIHMVMELCRGGELVHEIGRRPYTEKTVAGYMRSVLHTLAQCHSHRILHRDIKPGNFMLLTSEEDSPLKAIDFGLAVFFDPDKLPRTDLGLEGTPWFMAPETLSSQTYPASDVWAAGVMAYQLLSGYLPFDDARNPNAPALSVIWKGILTEQPSFRRSAWKEVSEEAQDFVKTLLNKDHAARPSAKEALRHPWLSPAFHEAKSRPISATVVQRIQRFAQTNVVRRTILELIAQELLKLMPAMSPTVHGPGEYGSYLAAQQQQQAGGDGGSSSTSSPVVGACGAAPIPGAHACPMDASGGDGGIFPMSPEGSHRGSLAGASPRPPPALQLGSPALSDHMGRSASVNIAELARQRNSRTSIDSVGSGQGGDSFRATSLLSRYASRGPGGSAHGGRLMVRSPSTQQLALLARASERGRGSATVHGPGDYFRVMRQASEIAAMESGHGKTDYLRVAPRTEEERLAARKAARLSLDTSAHGGDEFQKILRQLEETREHRHKAAMGLRQTRSVGSLSLSSPAQQGQQQQQQQGQQQGGAAGPAGWPQHASPPGKHPPPLPPVAERAAQAPAAPAAAAAALGGAGAEPTPAAEERGRGRGAAKALLERLSAEPGSGGGEAIGGLETVPESPRGPPALHRDSPFASSHSAQLPGSAEAGSRAGKRVSFAGAEAGPGAETSQQEQQQGAAQAPFGLGQQGMPAGQQAQQPGQPVGWGAAAALSAGGAAAGGANGGKGGFPGMSPGLAAAAGAAGAGAKGPLGAVTNPRDLEQLMRRMQFRSNSGLGPDELSEGLRQLGYDLQPSEVAILMQQLDVNSDGQVHAPEFVASQMDWAALQENNRDLWLECAKRAFEGLDADSDGRLPVEALIGALRDKLPAAEVDYAVEDALVEAGYADADEVDFDGFLRMLRVGSYDSLDALDQYDARYGGSLRGGHSMELDGSQHMRLDTVPEETTQTPRVGGPGGSGGSGAL